MIIASLNVNSLLSHHDEIALLVKEQGIHFLALNETKIDKNCSSESLHIEGYKFERLDRNRNGGGVAFYIRDTFKYNVRKDAPTSSLELICAEITPPKSSPFCILSWYRPPCSEINAFNSLEHVLRFFECEGKEIILLGDTNCDLLSGSKISSEHLVPNHVKRICDIYQSFRLEQVINEPTRETIMTSTLLDHVAVSNAINIVESGVYRVALSDHYLVYAVRKFRGTLNKQHKVIRTRQMKEFDKELFLADLASVDWHSLLHCPADINLLVEHWTNMLAMIIQRHAPIIERRVSERYSPWITPHLKQMIRSRDKLKTVAIKKRSVILQAAYKQLRNKVNNTCKRLKREYYTEKIKASEGNLKQTWEIINKLVNQRSKTTIISSLSDGNKLILNPQDIANKMNSFFCNVGDQLSNEIPNAKNSLLEGSINVNPGDLSFLFSPILPQQVIRAMNKFKTSRSFGLDLISSYFLKLGMPILASPLSQIFNISMSQGIFPDDWKAARVAPVHKSGPTDDPSNYRPISVLPVVARLFGKLVYDQMYSYLNDNKLLYSKQSGFRSMHSVLSCLLKCTNDWYLNLDTGNFTSVTVIDLKKAFDTVNHEILLEKIYLYGIKDKEFYWFRSYLSHTK